nr:methylenetetrahydrofolate reductase [Agromyces protaetiae]
MVNGPDDGNGCRPPISFELYPPRTDAAAIALGRTIDRLAEVDPAFISVTFGAGGSTRDRSLTVLRYILEQTSVEPMAHLTCVGSSHEQANQLVRRFLDAGIRSFLALRGDPPVGADPDAGLGDLGSAAELVQLIHRVQEEREPFGQVGIPGLPGMSSIRERPRPERVAVAAFPAGHPRSRSPDKTSTRCSRKRSPERTSPSRSSSGTPTTTSVSSSGPAPPV